jgi:hypothetical protein
MRNDMSVSDQRGAIGEGMTGNEGASQAPLPGKVPLDLLPDSGAGNRCKDDDFSDVADERNYVIATCADLQSKRSIGGNWSIHIHVGLSERPVNSED